LAPYHNIPVFVKNFLRFVFLLTREQCSGIVLGMAKTPIQRLVDKYKGNKRQVAEMLGVSLRWVQMLTTEKNPKKPGRFLEQVIKLKLKEDKK